MDSTIENVKILLLKEQIKNKQLRTDRDLIEVEIQSSHEMIKFYNDILKHLEIKVNG